MNQTTSSFIMKLAKIMAVDGKVNATKYSEVLSLVAEHFKVDLAHNYKEPPDTKDKEIYEVVWGEPLRNRNEAIEFKIWCNENEANEDFRAEKNLTPSELYHIFKQSL